MVCPGLVTNATTFGVFVDIGVPHDGLVHVSQLPTREGDKAAPLLLPGDRVEVRVVKVDLAKKQISLSMRGAPARSGERPRTAQPRADGKERAERAGDRRPRGSSTARPGSSRPRPGPRPGTTGTPPSAGEGEPSPTAVPPPGAAAPNSRRDARPEPLRGPRPGRPDRPAPRPEPPRPSTRPPAFNNPFAVLATLKQPKKS
jgi:predicted RNA-binding protein with RPS1 domain